MSKVTKEQAQEALETLSAYVNQEEGGEEAATTVEIPSADEIASMSKDDVLSLASQLGFDTEGKKLVVVKSMLSTLSRIKNEEELTDEDEVDDLAETLGLTPDKKQTKTIAAIKQWADSLGESGEVSTEEEATEEATEEGTEEPAEGEEATEEGTEPADEEGTEGVADGEATTEEQTPPDDQGSETDGVDREAVAKKFKQFPEPKIMIQRLEAYNKHADEAIEFDKKNPKEGYRSLVAQLVTTSSQVAAWGLAYIRDNAGYCCGLPLSDVKIKGIKNAAGKCQITGKVFILNDDQSGFNEHKK